MIVETLAVGFLQCNCTIVGCPRTGEALVVDPGGDVDRILEIVQRRGWRVTRIAHTHAHFDHVMGTAELQARTGAEVLLHPGDDFLYRDLADQLTWVGLPPLPVGAAPPVDRDLEHGMELPVGQAGPAEVLHTPGHTPGSVCFALETPEGPLLLSGDTLFQASVGRTDFPGGDARQLLTSIGERLLVRDPRTRVIPGHGPETNLGWERKHNPFLRQL